MRPEACSDAPKTFGHAAAAGFIPIEVPVDHPKNGESESTACHLGPCFSRVRTNLHRRQIRASRLDFAFALPLSTKSDHRKDKSTDVGSSQKRRRVFGKGKSPAVENVCQANRGEVYAFQIKILVRNVKSLQQQIEETDKAIENSMQPLELPPWKTIPNVGILTMATLLGDVGDPRLFGSAKKFASFLGLTPRGKQSGSSINRKGHISKCGPSHARQKLYMCVVSALSTKKNPLIIEIYNRLVSKGKPKNVAIVACMNHLARIIYGVFKSNQPFNPEYQGLNSGLGRPQNGNLATMPGVLLPRPLGNITAT